MATNKPSPNTRTGKRANPTASLVRVGGGRGFVVGAAGRRACRFVITAAHCLKKIPGAPVIRKDWAETFPNLLGPLGKPTTVWAECLFVDPIADVAVLGSPDNQELFEKAEAYDALIDTARPSRIGDVAAFDTPTAARLIALDGRLIDCTVRHFGRCFTIENVDGIVGGMSGSPVLDHSGAAIGIISQSHGSGRPKNDEAVVAMTHSQGWAPRLVTSLPGWLLLDLGAVKLLTGARRALRAHYR